MGVRAVPGKERQLVGLRQNAGEISAAQVLLAGTGLSPELDDEAGVDVAVVVATDTHASSTHRSGTLTLRDRATPPELGAHRRHGSVVGVPVDRARVERALELLEASELFLAHDDPRVMLDLRRYRAFARVALRYNLCRHTRGSRLE